MFHPGTLQIKKEPVKSADMYGTKQKIDIIPNPNTSQNV